MLSGELEGKEPVRFRGNRKEGAGVLAREPVGKEPVCLPGNRRGYIIFLRVSRKERQG